MERHILNQKQRDFLIDICGKIIVYLFTVALVGRFFDKGISIVSVIIMIVGGAILTFAALFLAKEGNK